MRWLRSDSSNVFWIFPLLAFYLSRGLWVPRLVHPDETWTLSAIAAPSPQALIGFVFRDDNHPPLYYLILQAWDSVFGFTIPSSRLMSYVFGLVALFVFFYASSRLRWISGAVPLLLLATNPLFAYYSVTTRPYSLVVALASIATLAGLRLHCVEHRDSPLDGAKIVWIRLVFYGGCFLLGLTHYYGVMVALSLLLFDLVVGLTKRWSLWPAGMSIVAILVWPILQLAHGVIGSQGMSNSWVNVVPFVSTANNFLAAVFPDIILSRQPYLLFGVLLAALLIVLVVFGQDTVSSISLSSLKSRIHSLPRLRFLGLIQRPGQNFYLLVVIVIVLLASLVADQFMPFSTPYYFLVCLPAFVLLYGNFHRAFLAKFGSIPANFLLISVLACQVIHGGIRLLKI